MICIRPMPACYKIEWQKLPLLTVRSVVLATIVCVVGSEGSFSNVRVIPFSSLYSFSEND